MFKIEVKTIKRVPGKKELRVVRKKGLIPLVIYGDKIEESLCGAVGIVDANHLYKAHLHNEVVNVEFDGKKYPVLVREVSKDVVNGSYVHFDLLNINLKEEVEVEIQIELVGESLAVKNDGGVLVQNRSDLTIKVLPTEIPEKIEVDISVLTEIGTNLTVGDIKNTVKFHILTSDEEVIALIANPVAEEEVAPTESEETLIDKLKAEEAAKQAEAGADKDSKNKK